MLVNRQCMAPVLHDIAGTSIVKAVFFTFKRGEELAGETEGTNSIPYAKKLDLGPKMAIRITVPHKVCWRMWPSAPVVFPCQSEITELWALQYATSIDEPRQATCSEGTT
jgi:hypothetical protein